MPFAAVASAGALNVFLMRGEEIRRGIDVFPVLSEEYKREVEAGDGEVKSLGKSKVAAKLAVGETALSRVLNATPIMVLPPLILVRLQRTEWLKERPRMVLPLNLGMFTQSMIHVIRLMTLRRLNPHNIYIRSTISFSCFSTAPGRKCQDVGG